MAEKRIIVMASEVFTTCGERLANFLGVPFISPFTQRFANGDNCLYTFPLQHKPDRIIVYGSGQSRSNAGDSNLMKNRFLEVLAFAKEYADKVTAISPLLSDTRAHRPIVTDAQGEIIWKNYAARTFLLDILAPYRADTLITLDIHCPEIITQLIQEGLIGPHQVYDLQFNQIMHQKIKRQVAQSGRPTTLIHPDKGSVQRNSKYPDLFGITNVLYVNKKRKLNGALDDIEYDLSAIAGHNIYIVDDMIDTFNTLCGLIIDCKENGAAQITIVASHFLVNNFALSNLEKSPLDRIITTNSVPIRGLPCRTRGRMEIEDIINLISNRSDLVEMLLC